MAKVLLVEDDRAVRNVLTKALAGGGHDVTGAADGSEALKLIDSGEFDLVVADILMPDVDGMQLLRELRTRKSPVKVIAISGGGRGPAADYLEMATVLGAVAALQKPVSSAALLGAVARALETT